MADEGNRSPKRTFYEFFCGGGLARLALAERWSSIFANDVCPKKSKAYCAAFGNCPELVVGDIRRLKSDQLPGSPELAWASFPCQDLSLAGKGRGLRGHRSSTFWPFLDLVIEKNRSGSPIPVLVIENVVGTVTSNGGRDFSAILAAISEAGYRHGTLIVDARYFVPQSRPRLFLIAVNDTLNVPQKLTTGDPDPLWTSARLCDAYARLSKSVAERTIWWKLPAPPRRNASLADIIEPNPTAVTWHTNSETKRLLTLMSPRNREKIRAAQLMGKTVVGTLYRRTRPSETGVKAQRAEVRFDQISGCLRTPAGGSSRQTLLIVEGKLIRSRLISAREAARLMGVPDSYPLPTKYNDAYKLMGDGVVVPVVSWLDEHILTPLTRSWVKKQAGRSKHVA